MKRAAFLLCAGVDAPRYKLLKQRNQLPFVPEGDDVPGSHTDYSLDDAFRLRLMLDLIGGESTDDTQLNGLGPSYAAQMVWNAMTLFPRHPLNQVEPLDWWFGVVVFEQIDAEGDLVRFSDWYAGELGMMGAWIQQKQEQHNLRAVRVFTANVTRAAEFVRDQAEDLGIAEASDFSEVSR